MSSEPTIRVKHLNGEEYPTTIPLHETIGTLKDKVSSASGIAAARQRLIYKGKEVHNHVQLAAAGLADGSVIHLVERLIAPASAGQTPSVPQGDAQAQSQAGASAFSGPGLEAVNAIVSQVVGGLLGPATSHGSQPGSPRPPHRRRRAAPPLNGLVALHGYLNRISDLQTVDDPPAMLPVVRTGLPDSHRSWHSVTSATTAVLNSSRQRHGTLQDALSAATGEASLPSPIIEQLDSLLQRAVAQQQQDAPSEGTNSTPLSAEPTRGPGVSTPTGDEAASQSGGQDRTEGSPSDTYEFMQLIVLAYALTMAQAAESIRSFAASFSERAASLARDLLRDLESGSTTFERSQVHMERLGTTANRMSGLAVESAYLCGLFANAVRGDHRMLADGMNPVVLMTDQQHSRALRHAATIMPQVFPNGQPPTAAATSAPRQPSSDAIPRISINPGFAPMLVGSPGLRRIMPTRSSTARANTVTSTGGADSPAAAPPGDDASTSAAWSLLQGMLGSTADFSAVMGGLPGDPMTSPLAPGTQPPTSRGAAASTGDAGAAQGQDTPSVPGHSSEPQVPQVHGLPIFNQDPSSGGGLAAAAGPGMPLAGVHISSSIVTGGLPFGSTASAGGGAPGAGAADGAGAAARGVDGIAGNPDNSTDVGGMIIQLELPQDGGGVTSIQTTGIGQLGSVLQNMMQEQLAFARERMRDPNTSRAGSGGAGSGGAAAGGPTASATGRGGTTAASAAQSGDPPAGAPETGEVVFEYGPAGADGPVRALPARVLRLTQQLVTDVQQHQALPEQDRDAEAGRLVQEYLQQVPDLLRSALPAVADGVDHFLNRGQASDSAAAETATATADATAQTTPDLVPPPAAPAPAAPGPEAAPASASGSGTGGSDPKEPAGQSVAAGTDVGDPTQQAGAQASTSRGATATAIASGSQSRPSPALPKRPEPKGLAGGLKPRKPRSSGLGAVAAGATAPGAAPGAASGPATAGTVALSAPAAPGGGGGGTGSPLDALMPLMQSPQMQQMLNSPQVQGMAEQMSSGNADLGSLMQSMMPMVSSMLGGAPPGQGGSGASGLSGQAPRSGGGSSAPMPPAASAEMKAILVQELGAEEAARWQRVMKEDKALMQQAGKSAGQHSTAYAAGSVRDAEGDKGALF
eukprot:jgi/Ulvmu1/8060/UM004_0297.1